MQQARKSGFTLVELMVVIAIAAIVASITFGAFRSISEGNKRSTCQSNLSQIYQACRLYAQDYNGKFPYLNPKADVSTYVAPVGTNTPDSTPAGGIGLWSLYTYRKPNDANCDYPHNSVDLPLPDTEPTAPALAGYVKNVRVFHCPSDNFDRNIEYRSNPTNSTSACITQKVLSGSLTFVSASSARRLNPSYLSYQTGDDVIDTSSTANPAKPINTYSSFRLAGPKTTSGPTKDADKQLIYFVKDSTGVTSTPERPYGDQTIITWCRFHRISKEESGELTSQLDRRNYDNVLFSDGTVQNLPAQEDKATFTACNSSTATGDCVTGWQRVPKSYK